MRLLLDTHVALWAVLDSPKLAPAARKLIVDDANDIAVSVVTLWEIAIKRGLRRRGPGAMPVSASDAALFFAASGYDLLPVLGEHACAVETLPRHHADPFDRLLVAQANTEPRRLLTQDATLAPYGEMVLLAA